MDTNFDQIKQTWSRVIEISCKNDSPPYPAIPTASAGSSSSNSSSLPLLDFKLKLEQIQQLLELIADPNIGDFRILVNAILTTITAKLYSFSWVLHKESLPWSDLLQPLVDSIQYAQHYRRLCQLEDRVKSLQISDLIKGNVTGNSLDQIYSFVESEISKTKEIFLQYNFDTSKTEILDKFKNFRKQVEGSPANQVSKTINENLVAELRNDIRSFERIIKCIMLAQELNIRNLSPFRTEHRKICSKYLFSFAVQRALQVAGEYFKGTEESLHLSKEKQDLLAKSGVPLDAISTFRNILSHSNTLLIQKRRKLEWERNTSVTILHDLVKIREMLESLRNVTQLTLLKLEILTIVDMPLEIKAQLECAQNLSEFNELLDGAAEGSSTANQLRFSLQYRVAALKLAAAEQLVNRILSDMSRDDNEHQEVRLNRFKDLCRKFEAASNQYDDGHLKVGTGFDMLGKTIGLSSTTDCKSDLDAAAVSAEELRQEEASKEELQRFNEFISILLRYVLSREEFDELSLDFSRHSDLEILEHEVTDFIVNRYRFKASQQQLIQVDTFKSRISLYIRLQQFKLSYEARRGVIELLSNYQDKIDRETLQQRAIKSIKQLSIDLDTKDLLEAAHKGNLDFIFQHLTGVEVYYKSFIIMLINFHYKNTQPKEEELQKYFCSEHVELIKLTLIELKTELDLETSVEKQLAKMKNLTQDKMSEQEFTEFDSTMVKQQKFHEIKAKLEVHFTNTSQSSVSLEDFDWFLANLASKPFKGFGLEPRNTKSLTFVKTLPNPYGKFLVAMGTRNTFKDLFKAFEIFLKSLKLTFKSSEHVVRAAFKEVEEDRLTAHFFERLAMLNKLLTINKEWHRTTSQVTERDVELLFMKRVHEETYLSAIAFLLLDLMDTLQTIQVISGVTGLELLLLPSFTELLLDDTNSYLAKDLVNLPGFSLRNFLAHGDDVLEGLYPNLNTKFLLQTALNCSKYGEMVIALKNVGKNADLVQFLGSQKTDLNLLKNLPSHLDSEQNRFLLGAITKCMDWKEKMEQFLGQKSQSVETKLIPGKERDYLAVVLRQEICQIVRNQDNHQHQRHYELVQQYFNNADIPSNNWSITKDTSFNPLVIAVGSGNLSETSQISFLARFSYSLSDDLLTSFRLAGYNGKLVSAELLLKYIQQQEEQLPEVLLELEVYVFESLRTATFQGHRSFVKGFLKWASQRSTFDHLHCIASKHNQIETAQDLLEEAGTDPNATMNGSTALSYAVRAGNAELVRILLSHGVDPTLKGSSNWTPSEEAILNSNLEVVKLLIDYVDLSEKKWNSLIAHVKRLPNYWTVLNYVSEQRSLRFNTVPAENELVFAVLAGELQTVQRLIERGGDVNTCSTMYDSRSLLHLAVTSLKSTEQHLKITGFLLKMGANVHARDRLGNIPLHYAANAQYLDPLREMMFHYNLHKAQLLLQYGSDINARNSSGESPLHTVAYQSKEVLQYYVECGFYIDFNVTNLEGQTPLHLAAKFGDEGCVNFLVKKTDLDMLDTFGNSALHYAVKNKAGLGIVGTLLNNGADVFVGGPQHSVLHKAVKANVRRKHGTQMLNCILAAMKGDIRFESYLNAIVHVKKRKVYPKFEGECSPLMVTACDGAGLGTCKVLLQYGADLGLKNSAGLDAFDFAVLRGNEEVAQYLCRQLESIANR